jgi:membrane-associated phospholipid phosphatase
VTAGVTRHFWWGIALVLVSLMLGVAASSGALKSVDTGVLRALAMTQAQSAGWSIAVARFATRLGDPSTRSFMVIMILFGLIYRRCWRSATVFLVTVALSITGHSVAKEAFARARPAMVPWLDHADTYAYPSGHAAGAMVVLLLGALLLGGRRALGVALLVAVAIGLSRIALGVHWPSDVVGGWMFGGGMALIGYAVARQAEPLPVEQVA